MSHLLLGSEASSSNSSSSKPSSALPNGDYEVFLSFRGPDVRTSFADCLYSGLMRSKIRTFRDEEELHKGDKIASSLVQAITESKIYIPIFTKSYASSKWCLMELAKMVECWKRSKGHMFLPIFYFVDPRDVRHQDGPFKESFQHHNQKHDPNLVQKWREALQDVGEMKGWHVNESHGQGSVIDEILSKVELYLRRNCTMVTEELVGIDSHLENVGKLLKLDSAGSKVLGIHGMGGIGKTTTAKAVYDMVKDQFDKCCFLENARYILLKDDGIVSLQNRVISGVLGHTSPINNASEGINIIRDRVCKYKVLIVLDDVDESFEFDQVLGKLDNFSSESRFIVTTRDKRVLELLGDYELYQVEEMHYDHSLQLFSKHAFKMDYPQDGYAMLSQEFVKLAGGLPLALKVIGSLLFDRHTKFWEEKLIELRQVPCSCNKVQETLKLSYNELSHSEKQIFLDIACIFVGEDKEWPFYMWADCDFYPESGIRTLILRSLLKIDEEKCFWMHDHIRDLGRAMVAEEDIANPFNRSRIWSNYDAVNMLKHKKGADRVEIMRVTVDDMYNLTNEEFRNLSGLRYLDLTCGSLTGDFSEILPNLRWFRLDYYYGPIPTNINFKKCIILELDSCRVTDDWKGWKEIKVAGKLKVLKLNSCRNLEKAPDLSSCRGLEDLHLVNCQKMKGHLNIGNLKKLKKLVLWDNCITELRGDIGLLEKLEDIRLTDLRLREAPPGIGKLSSLGSLDMTSRFCKMEVREDVPASLKTLSISCPTVPNLLELQQLEDLLFSCCTDKPEIPGDLWKLPKLKTLVILGCSSQHFTTLLQVPVSQSGLPPPVLPSSLNKLNVCFCDHLQTLPNLANLNNLTALHLKGVIIRMIPGLGELKMLATLELFRIPNLEYLDGLENLAVLAELRVQSCGVSGKFPNLSNLIKLNTLVIGECGLLTEIQGLSRSLKSLEVSNCPCLSNVGDLESLESLQVLRLDRCCMSAKWLPPSLSKFGKLEELRYVEDESLPDHMSLKELPHLPKSIKVLKIRCNGLEVITGLDQLESIQSLLDVSRLCNLEKLDVRGCFQLSEVRGLGGLVSLQELVMSECSSLTELDLSGLMNLRRFEAEGCTRLRKVNGLEELEALQVLKIAKRLKYNVLEICSSMIREVTNCIIGDVRNYYGRPSKFYLMYLVLFICWAICKEEHNGVFRDMTRMGRKMILGFLEGEV